ncbi:hypothetical protein OKW47_002161 [Paraburkholderia atlantica]
MTALSLPWNVRGHGFQMHHYPCQARGPAYELAVLAVFFAYFLCSSVWTADMGNRCAGTWVTHDPLIWGSPG